LGDIILRLEQIKKGFGDVEVLRGIDLEVERGEFITLLGPSGCGKTTTLRIIAGLETPDSGRVLLENRDVTHEEPNKRDVNTVFQNYALFPHMTVAANIGYSLKLKHKDKAYIQTTVGDALDLVQLPGYEKRMPSELSGGQRQRVAIARAIVNEPKVLLLDEPLGALDLKLRHQMQVELKRLQERIGITFIYITHDQEEALNMSDRIAVMKGGLFEQIGTPREVYDRPKTSYVANFVGSANLLSGTVSDVDRDSVAIQNESGTVKVQSRGEGLTVGQQATAAVRRELITLLPKQAATPGLLGVIKQSNFAGGIMRVFVELRNGDEWVAVRYGLESDVKPGDEVLVHFEADNAVLVDVGGAQ